MTFVRRHRHTQGFSLIEAILMIAAILIFTLLLYGVLKKDYLSPPAKPSAVEPPKPAAPADKSNHS